MANNATKVKDSSIDIKPVKTTGNSSQDDFSPVTYREYIQVIYDRNYKQV